MSWTSIIQECDYRKTGRKGITRRNQDYAALTKKANKRLDRQLAQTKLYEYMQED